VNVVTCYFRPQVFEFCHVFERFVSCHCVMLLYVKYEILNTLIILRRVFISGACCRSPHTWELRVVEGRGRDANEERSPLAILEHMFVQAVGFTVAAKNRLRCSVCIWTAKHGQRIVPRIMPTFFGGGGFCLSSDGDKCE
jgi:hypothetical protein